LGRPRGKIFMIFNRQRSVRVPSKELDEFFARARRLLRVPSDSFSVCLVSDAEMARWNRAYRGKPGPTDVLSFRAGERATWNGQRKRRPAPGKAKGARYLGDIAIAPAVARRNAARFGRTLSEEMRILILHGMLHLMGYDHETDRGQMDRRERRLRRSLGLS
jgi:probable rRNA maturation factor